MRLRRAPTIIAAVSVCAATSIAGDPPGIVQLRLIPSALNANGQLAEFEDGSIGIDAIVQTTITDDPLAIGLAAGQVGFNDNDPNAAFAPGPLTLRELGADVDGFDPLGRAGLFPRFRLLVGTDNDNRNNGIPDFWLERTPVEWSILPLALHDPSAPRLDGEYEDVYKVRWSTTDRTPRTVLIEVLGAYAGYFVDDPDDHFDQPVPMNGAPRVRIVFSASDTNESTAEFLPGLDTLDCNTDDDPSVIDIRDMLVFVERWLNGDIAADVNFDGVVDVVDILEYVDCWLSESGGL